MEKLATRHNWAAAFLEFVNGNSIEEISETLDIPYQRLFRRARGERWASLVNKLTVAAPETDSPEAELAITRVLANREKNLVIACKLQADVLEQVELLQNGTLTVSRQTSTGTVIKMPAGIKERAELAGYARDVAELSYRALGDAAPSRAEGGSSSNSAYTPITIILPQVIALPRSARSEAVIELQG
jgi:hypothetical protein